MVSILAGQGLELDSTAIFQPRLSKPSHRHCHDGRWSRRRALRRPGSRRLALRPKIDLAMSDGSTQDRKELVDRAPSTRTQSDQGSISQSPDVEEDDLKSFFHV